jgi:hypothetical protein
MSQECNNWLEGVSENADVRQRGMELERDESLGLLCHMRPFAYRWSCPYLCPWRSRQQHGNRHPLNSLVSI